MKKSVLLMAVLAAAAVQAAPRLGGTGASRRLHVTAERMAADNVTGSVVVSGHVRAVYEPLTLLSELAVKDGDVYRFDESTALTTCTNDLESLHWLGGGEVEFCEGRYAIVRNMTLRLWGVPVAWLPYWYHPLDTNYGLRMMPGYRSRWGAYLMTRYVYGLAGSFDEGAWGLKGSTRADWRYENGLALGQNLRWQLGDFGRGSLRTYYAWDQDAKRYDRHWRDPDHWNYSNWGSDVPSERYAVEFSHRWEATERDVVRVAAAWYSDSYFREDFLRTGRFGLRDAYLGGRANEAAWEHLERGWGAGVSASGPVNDFFGGTARLPEAYFDFLPTAVFSTPLVYESENRLGYLDRDYARYGDRNTALPFRYSPGAWANYNAFRLDTYHRLTAPCLLGDVVSAVPRLGWRGTYWNQAGATSLDGRARAGRAAEDVFRSVIEGGVTFSARGQAAFEDGWLHVVEPYFDVLAQEADCSGLKRGARPYVFDALDASRDWSDQFAGRSRNLPYSWYGVTPGVRNVLRRAVEGGSERTVADVDAYASVQLNGASHTAGGRYHRLARSAEEPNLGSGQGYVVPGMRVRYLPTEATRLSARVEYDAHENAIALADVDWRQRLSESFSYGLGYAARDHRIWDYSSRPFDAAVMRSEDFNWARYSYLRAEAEHEICDAVAWGPFVSWDVRRNELDEIGTWLDLRTDCLGFRFSLSYVNDYVRLDGSEHDDDWRCGFYVYLRALGPDSSAAIGN